MSCTISKTKLREIVIDAIKRVVPTDSPYYRNIEYNVTVERLHDVSILGTIIDRLGIAKLSVTILDLPRSDQFKKLIDELNKDDRKWVLYEDGVSSFAVSEGFSILYQVYD